MLLVLRNNNIAIMYILLSKRKYYINPVSMMWNMRLRSYIASSPRASTIARISLTILLMIWIFLTVQHYLIFSLGRIKIDEESITSISIIDLSFNIEVLSILIRPSLWQTKNLSKSSNNWKYQPVKVWNLVR